MEAFKRVNIEVTPKIIDKLQHDVPHAIVPCQMLEMYRQCQKMEPSLDVRLYTPGGIVDNYGTFFLYVHEHRGNMLFHTTSADHENLKRQILDIPDIQWNSTLVLGPIDVRFRNMILELMHEKKLKFFYENKISDNLMMPLEEALNLTIEVPKDMELKQIKLADAEFVNDRWPHKGPRTLRYIRDTIKLNGGFALYFKGSDDPVSWGLHSLVGGVGMIQTVKEQRGKHLGEIIGRAISRSVAQKGMEPHLQVNQDLPASYRMFTRMGYHKTHELSWYCFTNNGSLPPPHQSSL